MTLRGLADVRVTENHVSFCRLKTLEKHFEKIMFVLPKMMRKSMKDS